MVSNTTTSYLRSKLFFASESQYAKLILAETAHLAIGDQARLTGTKVNTIRFYEEVGLLHQAERTSSGRRIYRDEDTSVWRSYARAGTWGFRWLPLE